MASVNQALGSIGAAKIFTSSVSNALGDTETINQAEITELEEQLANTSDKKQRSKIQRQIKRLQRKNKVANVVNKVYEGATDLLLVIAEFCDIGEKAIINWLAKYIIIIVPELEIAVKMILLTNIKKMVSCSLDPRIPDSWRTSGETINIKEIDPRNILQSSPYSKWGRYQYFGVFADDEDLVGKPLHSLARATDMNAFIWYAKNCAHYVSPINIQTVNSSTGEVNGDLSDLFDVTSGDTLYDRYIFPGNRSKGNYLPGCTFKQTGLSNTIFLCTDRTDDEDPSYTIVPCTNTWTSVNWYKNRSNPFKSRPLFSLEFSNQYNLGATLPKDNFRFKILPKPLQITYGFIGELGNAATTLGDLLNKGISNITEVSDGEVVLLNPLSNFSFPGFASLKPYTARFGKSGKYDKRGQYSIDENRFTVVSQKLGSTKLKKILLFHLYDKYGDQQEIAARLIFDKTNKNFYLSKTDPTEENPHGTTLPTALASRVLIECYFGKTVYEFNYDYVMSFRLFDAKVIAANIINGLMNINLPNPFKRGGEDDGSLSNTDQLYLDNMVDSMLQKLILEEQEEETEFKDCFYTFSNEEYTKLEDETAKKAINGSLLTYQEDDNINEIYDILNSYSTDATLNEQTEILTQVFTKASQVVSDSNSSSTDASASSSSSSVDSSTSSSSGGGDNFIKKAIKFLINEIVNAIITPKVLMLIIVNQKLMGNDPLSLDKNYSFSVQDILNGLKGILSALIKEVVDSIQKELLRIILAQISIILLAYIKKLALEYAKKWVNLLKQLLACFKFNKKSLNGGGNDGGYQIESAINSALDNIDGADIDALAGQILPNTNPCD